MNALLGSIWSVVVAIWGIGNYWLRAAIVIIASWPVLITLAAFIGWPALTATVALLPLFAMVVILMTVFNPLVLVALVPFGFGRRTLTGLAGIIGLELAIGAYFAAVPVASDPGLIPLQLLLIIGIIFLVISGFRRIAVLLGLVLVVIAAISFLGGREKASERLEQATASASSASSGGRVFVVGPRDEVEVILPPNSFANFCTDKPLLVRPADGGSFELRPPCRPFKAGGIESVQVMGDPNGSGVFHFRAKNKEMARLTLTTTRK